MTGERNRGGFTLAEILVSVAIIALLASVIVPTVGGALFKGDVGRVQTDLTNIRGGIEQFVADVRRYPGRVGDLSTLILANGTDLNSNDTTAFGTAYGAPVVLRWKGPYLNTPVGKTGAGGTIATNFVRVDCITGLTTGLTNSVTTSCLAVIVTGISLADATRIDAAMDDGNLTNGMVRFVAGTNTLMFLAVPIQ